MVQAVVGATVEVGAGRVVGGAGRVVGGAMVVAVVLGTVDRADDGDVDVDDDGPTAGPRAVSGVVTRAAGSTGAAPVGEAWPALVVDEAARTVVTELGRPAPLVGPAGLEEAGTLVPVRPAEPVVVLVERC